MWSDRSTTSSWLSACRVSARDWQPADPAGIRQPRRRHRRSPAAFPVGFRCHRWSGRRVVRLCSRWLPVDQSCSIERPHWRRTGHAAAWARNLRSVLAIMLDSEDEMLNKTAARPRCPAPCGVADDPPYRAPRRFNAGTVNTVDALDRGASAAQSVFIATCRRILRRHTS